jgi:hypothetical protein
MNWINILCYLQRRQNPDHLFQHDWSSVADKARAAWLNQLMTDLMNSRYMNLLAV